MMYYYLPQPPFLLIAFGFFIAIASGLAFESTLKLKYQEWRKTSQELTLDIFNKSDLRIPFWGICIGICIFLSASLEIFNVSSTLGYIISIPLSGFIGRLIWKQLGEVLLQLKQGGSKAIDLDSFE
jgi:hypothetical protein